MTGETVPPTADPPRAPRILGLALLASWVLFTTPGAWKLDALAGCGAAGLCFGLLVALAWPKGARGFERVLLALPRRRFLALASLVAVVTSSVLAFVTMRGLPVSIDASVYLFEARALSHFHFGMPFPGPRLSFGERFLFEGPDGHLHGVFPPGYPLFLAPFTAIGLPVAAGPVTALLLVLAHYAAGIALTRDERATRFAVLLSLPTYARAIETADLLSHAFVAVLGCAALALAALLRERPRAWAALALGACLGWAFAARLLDGLVFAAFALACVLTAPWLRRGLAHKAPGIVALALVGALPFAMLVAAQQKAATGSYFTPTQHEYFARSDYPSTCHRLGFGRDVGCYVEHPEEAARFAQTGGYTLSQGLQVTRERATRFSVEVFGLVVLAWLCFAQIAYRPDRRDLALGSAVVAFTAVYALFYYGNAVLHGARHLFPVQPLFTLLAARAALAVRGRRPEGQRFDGAHLRGVASLGLLGAVIGSAAISWPVMVAVIDSTERPRIDIRRFIAQHHLDDGMVIVTDHFAWTAAFDPYRDGAQLVPVMNDRVGMRELRRARPNLTPYFLLPGGALGRPQFPPPPPDIRIEIDRAWPSFQFVDHLGARAVNTMLQMRQHASGDVALLVFAAEPDATFRFHFDIGTPGRFVPHVEGFAGPTFGDYEFTLDGHPLPRWNGYAPLPRPLRNDDGDAMDLGAGLHVFAARCVGRHDASTDYHAVWDSLVLVPVE